MCTHVCVCEPMGESYSVPPSASHAHASSSSSLCLPHVSCAGPDALLTHFHTSGSSLMYLLRIHTSYIFSPCYFISYSKRYAACKHFYNLNVIFALSFFFFFCWCFFFFSQSASGLHLPKRTLNAIKEEIRTAPQKVFKNKGRCCCAAVS